MYDEIVGVEHSDDARILIEHRYLFAEMKNVSRLWHRSAVRAISARVIVCNRAFSFNGAQNGRIQRSQELIYSLRTYVGIVESHAPHSVDGERSAVGTHVQVGLIFPRLGSLGHDDEWGAEQFGKVADVGVVLSIDDLKDATGVREVRRQVRFEFAEVFIGDIVGAVVCIFDREAEVVGCGGRRRVVNDLFDVSGRSAGDKVVVLAQFRFDEIEFFAVAFYEKDFAFFHQQLAVVAG